MSKYKYLSQIQQDEGIYNWFHFFDNIIVLHKMHEWDRKGSKYKLLFYPSPSL